jgi:signal transduction histidine kinase
MAENLTGQVRNIAQVATAVAQPRHGAPGGRVRVTDTGVGIPVDKLSLIFEASRPARRLTMTAGRRSEGGR